MKSLRNGLGRVLLLSLFPLTDCLGDLVLPPITQGPPEAGKRLRVTAQEYAGTSVHHAVYLPPDWSRGEVRWPVIVEYTGNAYPPSGSTGKVEDAGMGYGLCEGKFIWLTLPFVGRDGRNALTWWGDEAATVRYAKSVVPKICAEYGGDPNKVYLCGFSRGAIAVNYIGLYDDEIAKLWAGFITHDHYDGVREWKGTDWGTPLKPYRASAKRRLERLKGRSVLICQADNTADIRAYLDTGRSLEPFTFVNVSIGQIFPSFPNSLAIHPHTDRWLLRESAARDEVRAWFQRELGR